MHMQHGQWVNSSLFSPLQLLNSARISLLNDLNSVDRTLLNLSVLSLVNVLLYGGPQIDDSQNAFILNSSIKYISISESLVAASSKWR